MPEAATFSPLESIGESGKKYALLIGIDEYEDKDHIAPLSGAALDAREMAAALREVAGFTDPATVRLLVSDAKAGVPHEAKPTRNQILAALTWLKQTAKPGDTIWVLCAGHGLTLDGTSYLLPYDAVGSGSNNALLAQSSISVRDINRILQDVQARTLLLAFDMCRTSPNGGIRAAVQTPNILDAALVEQSMVRRRSVAGAGSSTESKSSAANDRLTVTLFACKEGQSSYEWTEAGRGYFSYFLEWGLRGGAADMKGEVHLNRLVEFVRTQTEAAVKADRRGAQQTPRVRYDDELPDNADRWVLATNVSPLPLATMRGTRAITAIRRRLLFDLLEQAKQLAHFKKDDSFEYSRIAEALYYVSTVDEAKQVAFHREDPASQAEILRVIADLQRNDGDIVGAVQTARQARVAIHDAKYMGEVISSSRDISELQIQLRDFAEAQQTILGAIQRIEMNLSAYSRPADLNDVLAPLAALQAQAHSIEGAIATIRRVDHTGYQAKGMYTIVQGILKTVDVEKAYPVALSIRENKYKTLALCAVARAQATAKKRDIPDTLQILSQAMETVEKITAQSVTIYFSTPPKDETKAKIALSEKNSLLGEIASVQAFAGDIESAQQTVSRMTDTPNKEQDQDKSRALFGIAQTLSQKQRIDEALLVAQSIGFAPYKADALFSIIQALINKGDRARARQLIDQTLQSTKRADCERAALLLFKMGDMEAARKTMTSQFGKQLMESATPQGIQFVIGCQAQIRGLCSLADLQTKAKDTIGAKQTFQQAIQLAQKIAVSDLEEAQGQKQAIRTIVLAQAEIGDIQGAKQTLQLIDNKGIISGLYEKADLIRAVAYTQAQAGDFTGAILTSELMQANMAARSTAYCLIAVELAKTIRKEKKR